MVPGLVKPKVKKKRPPPKSSLHPVLQVCGFVDFIFLVSGKKDANIHLSRLGILSKVFHQSYIPLSGMQPTSPLMVYACLLLSPYHLAEMYQRHQRYEVKCSNISKRNTIGTRRTWIIYHPPSMESKRCLRSWSGRS